ncbi:MAG: S1 family peptidase [Myxococcota bacterium]
MLWLVPLLALAPSVEATSLPGSAEHLLEASQRIHEATVTFVPPYCAGVVVGDGRRTLTAAHCVLAPDQPAMVALYDGRVAEGRWERIDTAQDVAVLVFEEPLPVRGLAVAEQLPAQGEVVLFCGRDGGPHTQVAAVERLGRCPSLPNVAQALFTTLRGYRGESGAPVVDLKLQVVGLVHGGAACNIATPTATIASALKNP